MEVLVNSRTCDDDLVEAWLNFFEHRQDVDRWAVNQLQNLLGVHRRRNKEITADPEKAWEICLRLIDAASTRNVLFAIAAGPLQQLLELYFDQFIGRVRNETVGNVRLSYALSQICISNEAHLEQVFKLGHRAAVLDFKGESANERAAEINQLVTGWLQFHRNILTKQPNQYEWAADEVAQLPFSDPHKCWQIVELLIAHSQSEDELSKVGVVLGLLLELNHADFINVIKHALPADRRLAYTLTHSLFIDYADSQRLELDELINEYRVEHLFET